MLSTWLRGFGGALELFAVVLVVVDVRQAQGALPPGPPGLLHRLWNRALGRKSERHVRAVGSSLSIGSAIEVGAETWQEDWTNEEKIEELRDRIAELQKRTAKADQRIRQQADEERRHVAGQLDELRTKLQELESKREDATRRESRFRGYGVVPLMLGIVLTTWPTEIAGWFGAS